MVVPTRASRFHRLKTLLSRARDFFGVDHYLDGVYGNAPGFNTLAYGGHRPNLSIFDDIDCIPCDEWAFMQLIIDAICIVRADEAAKFYDIAFHHQGINVGKQNTLTAGAEILPLELKFNLIKSLAGNPANAKRIAELSKSLHPPESFAQQQVQDAANFFADPAALARRWDSYAFDNDVDTVRDYHELMQAAFHPSCDLNAIEKRALVAFHIKAQAANDGLREPRVMFYEGKDEHREDHGYQYGNAVYINTKSNYFLTNFPKALETGFHEAAHLKQTAAAAAYRAGKVEPGTEAYAAGRFYSVALNEHAFIQPPAKPKKENQNKQNMDVYYGKLNFYKQQHVEIAARNVGASAINAARAVYGPQAPSPTRELARNMGHLGLAA